MLSREDSLSGEALCWVCAGNGPTHTWKGEICDGKEPKSEVVNAAWSKSCQSLPVDTISLQMSPRFGDMPWITAFIGLRGLGLFHCQAQKQTTKKKER